MPSIYYYASRGLLSELKQEIAEELVKNKDKKIKDIIDLPDENGNTPLLLAAGEGHINVVEYLITQNANLRNPKGKFTPLDKAIYGVVSSIESRENPEIFYAIIKMLLQKDISLLTIVGRYRITPFDIASHEKKYPEIKQRFLQIIKNIDPTHPLLTDEEIIQHLQQEIARVKLTEIDFHARDFSDTNLSTEQQRVSKNIGEQYFKLMGRSPSLYRSDKLFSLFDRKEQKVIEYSYRWNPHVAAANDYFEIMQTLLNNGLDPNLMDEEHGTTLLAKASFSGHKEIVQLLLDKGASALKVNRDGQTPLQFLQGNLEGREKIVELLRSAEIKEGELMRPQPNETSQDIRHRRTLSEDKEQTPSSGIFSYLGSVFRRHSSSPARYQSVPIDETEFPQQSSKKAN
jgi:ankyrin repeat protein